MSLLRAVATISGLTMASRVFGLARDILSAAIMGAGPIADAFFVALRLPNFFRRMTAEGAFSVSFVPIFAKTLTQEGKEEAEEFSNQSLALLLLILVPFSLLAIIFMPYVIHVLAPGFDENGGERFDLAVTLTRITFFYLLCMSLCAMIGGMLNALDKFAVFAVAPVLFNIVQIIMLLVAFLFPTPGHALAWAVLISGVLQFIWMAWSLRRLGWVLKLVKPILSEKIRQLLRLMGPGLIGASAVQINLLVDTIIASTLPIGAVSYLYYADRLNQLPLGLIGTAVGTALLPKLAQRIAQNNPAASNHLFNRALEWTWLLTLPCAVALGVLAQPLVAVLFERGAFQIEATRATAYALQAYAIGLPAFVGIKVLSTALYAQQDTKTPVIITLICVVINIVLCLLFIEKLQHTGIALATSIAGWIQLTILGWMIFKRQELSFDLQLKRHLGIIIVACLVMAVGLSVAQGYLLPYIQQGGWIRFLAVLIVCSVGGILFLGLIFGLKVLNLKSLKQSFKGDI